MAVVQNAPRSLACTLCFGPTGKTFILVENNPVCVDCANKVMSSLMQLRRLQQKGGKKDT